MSTSRAPRQPREQQPSAGSLLAPLATTLGRRPMLVCAICFLLGIVIADPWQPRYLLPGLICIAAVIATILTARRLPLAASASILLAFLFLGLFLHSVRLTVPSDDISHSAGPARRTIEGPSSAPRRASSGGRSSGCGFAPSGLRMAAASR